MARPKFGGQTGTFAADLDAFAKRQGESLDNTVRAVTMSLFGAIIDATPRDTGRAMGNWQTTTDTPASDEVDRTGPESAKAELGSSAGGAGSKTYMTNNLPYIWRLEKGWSKQAPAGAMVMSNFQRIQAIVRDEAAKNKV